MADNEDDFLTVAEVAERLRLNQQTVRNWIDQGSLPALRVGRRVRIKRSDFDRLVSDGYRSGAREEVTPAGPSADDFWGGEPVGEADVGAAQDGQAEARSANGGHPAINGTSANGTASA